MPRLAVGVVCHPSVFAEIRIQLLQEEELDPTSIISALPLVVDPTTTSSFVEVFYDREKWEERIKKIEDQR